MRIREKKNQSYDRFRYLLEFQVKSGNVIEQEEPETETSGDIFDQISGAMDGRQPVAPASVDAEQPISDEVVADVDVNDNQTFEDTASDLLKIHASKIDNLTQYINDSVNILKVLSQKTDDITSNVDGIGGGCVVHGAVVGHQFVIERARAMLHGFAQQVVANHH
jgi:hypothetical protein